MRSAVAGVTCARSKRAGLYRPRLPPCGVAASSYNIGQLGHGLGVLCNLIGTRMAEIWRESKASMGLFEGVAQRGKTLTRGERGYPLPMTGWPVRLAAGCIGSGAIRLRPPRLRFKTMRPADGIARVWFCWNKSPAPATRRCCRVGEEQVASLLWARLPGQGSSRCRNPPRPRAAPKNSQSWIEAARSRAILLPRHIDLDLIVSVAAGAQFPRRARRVAPPPGSTDRLARDGRVLVYLSGIFWITGRLLARAGSAVLAAG